MRFALPHWWKKKSILCNTTHSCWLAHLRHLKRGMCSVCTCGERSYAPECADKLFKWGVVPGGTLTLSVVVFSPSHLTMLPTFVHSELISEFTALMQHKVEHSVFIFACIPEVCHKLYCLFWIPYFTSGKTLKPPPDWDYSMCRLLLNIAMSTHHIISMTHGFNKSYSAVVY